MMLKMLSKMRKVMSIETLNFKSPFANI